MYERFVKRKRWIDGGKRTDINKGDKRFKGLGKWTGWIGCIVYIGYKYT